MCIVYTYSFVDVPLESCGKASPMRVALQATAPDILLILLRYCIYLNTCVNGKWKMRTLLLC